MNTRHLRAWATRLVFALSACCTAGGAVAADTPSAAPPLKVLRYAFLIAETTFDPAQISDLYSNIVAAGLFDAPLEFEFLAKPVRMRAATLAALPEVSDDFKTFTFRVKPGIYFADDPVFQGKKRELVAEDYVYSLKRHYDPKWKSPNLYRLENAQVLGLSELRKKLMAEKKPFDYDTPVEGIQALDRYTFRIKLGRTTPRFLLTEMTDTNVAAALAREVVEFYGDKVGEHPVGTGPFVLKSWKRSSRIVLARNPNYREVLYDEHPPESGPGADARLTEAAARLKGRRLPMLDEVVIDFAAALDQESQRQSEAA